MEKKSKPAEQQQHENRNRRQRKKQSNAAAQEQVVGPSQFQSRSQPEEQTLSQQQQGLVQIQPSQQNVPMKKTMKKFPKESGESSQPSGPTQPTTSGTQVPLQSIGKELQMAPSNPWIHQKSLAKQAQQQQKLVIDPSQRSSSTQMSKTMPQYPKQIGPWQQSSGAMQWPCGSRMQAPPQSISQDGHTVAPNLLIQNEPRQQTQQNLPMGKPMQRFSKQGGPQLPETTQPPVSTTQLPPITKAGQIPPAKSLPQGESRVQQTQQQQQQLVINPSQSSLSRQMRKTMKKFPKQSGQGSHQQETINPTDSAIQVAPQSVVKDQQMPPSHQQMPLSQEASLAQQTQQQLVINPPQSSSSAPSKPSAIASRKSKVGFKPLEVVPGSCVGTRGRPLKIEANYLRIQLDQLVQKAYHYDIRFDPEKIPKKHLQDVVEKFRTKHFRQFFIAYDGQNSVYSAKPLPIPANVLKSEMLWHDGQTNRDRTITITIKEVDTCVIDLSAIKKYVYKSPGIVKPLRAIQCLEIVLRMPFSGKFVNVNRSFFTRPNRTIDLGENYELWTGLYQSVVLGDVPLFNIDVVNKAFPTPRSVLNILTDVMNVNVNQALYQPQELHEYLKGLTLVYNQPGTSFSNVFKYNGLKDSAKTQTFVLENRKLTVEQYFREKNIQLRYPHLPCLWCGPAIKNIYLPLEFCSVQDGQVIKKKLSENQIRTVIRETATSTDVRKRRIMDLLSKIRHNESKVVQEFGVSIGDKFTEVDARILTAPALEYLSNPEVRVDRGVWNAEKEKFLDGKTCTHWSVLKLDERCPNSDIFRFADMICEIGRKTNMSFAPRFTDLIEMRSNSRKQDIEQKMLGLKRKNVELLFVIIPNRNEAYPNVKQTAELKCGILTQCIKSFTLARKLNGSTVYNILLKLNSKLNGLNHKVPSKCTPPIGRGKIMIVGADVTHPTGTMNEPSAVGVASSHDVNALQYNMCWRIQSPTKEMITDLKNIMIEQLNYYKKRMNNGLPDKILYYRDGVSDGQFEDVLNIELSAIYMACQQMAPSYKPAVTFIVVQKRHNTRFYPTSSRDACGKNQNVMPGTIVDKFIIDPRHYQFFLVSHAAIQGVAKPTKYCIIWDDSNIKADELQALTYNLCHVFTRCNRAVSYVAPTYYAHLAAYRGKVYIQNDRINMDNLDHEFNQRQIRPEVSKDHPMFFV